MHGQTDTTPVLIAIDSDKAIKARARQYASDERVPWHLHDRAQLIYAVEGVMEVCTADGWWLIPPQRALWMPAHLEHSMRARSAVSLRSLYIASSHAPRVPVSQVTSVVVTPLLAALVLRAVEQAQDPASAREARLHEVLFDELVCLQDQSLHLPRARDPRLKRVCEAILGDPADSRSLEDWACIAGASSRTLARLYQQEFGMSYLAWRNQVVVLHSLVMLAGGAAVTRVAHELGYDSAGAFATMFKRLMGASPRRYIESVQVSGSRNTLS